MASESQPSTGEAQTLRRGVSTGRFVILDELGRGAMGTVYAAFDVKLERQVALKLLHRSDRGLDNLLAEAQALARINPPNVVTVHDVGTHQDRLFLAMAIHMPWTRSWIARWDDRLGHGLRNPVKKWWEDIEIVDGVPGKPRAGVNERDLNLDKLDPGSPIAYYNADVMPPGNRRDPVAVNRKAAVEAVRLIETPAQAARRRAAGEGTPSHYNPTPAD